MTVREFDAVVVGTNWRVERETRDTAWALSHIINSCGHLRKGTSVNVNKLAPRRNLAPRNPFYRGYLGMKS
jgi:hypothetical protein